jgi:hypothetical protein|tara:strand:- start:8246 stop:8446 length:201 start_codon:yes stop_codon:yes gene_type:complete
MVQLNKWIKMWFYEYIIGKKSLQEMSTKSGIPISTLHHHFKKHGLPMRSFAVARKIMKQRKKDAKS